MRITFWLSGVLLGTLLSTVGMADYVQNHPDSVLGRWVRPPIPVDPACEIDFAPPPVAGDMPEAADEPAKDKTETPATVPPAKNEEQQSEPPDEVTALEIAVEAQLPPDADEDADVGEDFFAMLADAAFALPKNIELLPIMPTEADEDEVDQKAEVKTPEECDDCDEVVYPIAIEWADAFYDWLQGCIADCYAFINSDDEETEVETAVMETPVIETPTTEKLGLELTVRLEIEAGRCALELKCGPRDTTPCAKPGVEAEPKPVLENAEALELIFYPEMLPMPFGPEFPAEDMKGDAEDQDTCLPGLEAVCPFCGKWLGCDRPTADTPDQVDDDSTGTGCTDMDEVDADSVEEELIDLVFHYDLDVL